MSLKTEFSVESPENFYGIPPCKDVLVIGKLKLPENQLD